MISFNKTPEGELWQEVIKLAMKDAGFHYDKKGGVSYIKPPLRKPKKEVKIKTPSMSIEAIQAIDFLLADSGDWKESREAICGMAMICPDQLRERCMKIIGRC